MPMSQSSFVSGLTCDAIALTFAALHIVADKHGLCYHSWINNPPLSHTLANALSYKTNIGQWYQWLKDVVIESILATVDRYAG